ncbi:unnamed protein product [Calypogeia fissa]
MALEPAILVVRADGKDKACVSEALAKHRGAEDIQISEDGVRIFSRNGEPVVVDTTTLNVDQVHTQGRTSKELGRYLDYFHRWFPSSVCSMLGRLNCIVVIMLG